MLFNLIVGIAAGYATPLLEPKMKEWAESIVLAPVNLTKTEFDVMALLIALFIGSLVLGVLGVDSSLFLVTIGAGIGLFGKRFYEGVKAKRKGPNY